MFIESHYKKENDPVIVFLNGGPGLASIHMAFTAIGPVLLRSDLPGGGFIEMNNTWCNNASVLFLDNPAGTGYSWADRKIDFFGNDFHMSREALIFMSQFYKDYPEYLKNDLFIAGVIYGGIYAPNLALKIHQHN